MISFARWSGDWGKRHPYYFTIPRPTIIIIIWGFFANSILCNFRKLHSTTLWCGFEFFKMFKSQCPYILTRSIEAFVLVLPTDSLGEWFYSGEGNYLRMRKFLQPTCYWFSARKISRGLVIQVSAECKFCLWAKVEFALKNHHHSHWGFFFHCHKNDAKVGPCFLSFFLFKIN